MSLILNIKIFLYDKKNKIKKRLFQVKTDEYYVSSFFEKSIIIEKSGVMPQFLPEIVNIGLKKNRLNIELPDRQIRLYSNVFIFPGYSFVFRGDQVEIPKLKKDIINIKAKIAEKRIKLTSEQLILQKKSREIFHSPCGMSLMGHYSLHFGHFILEYLERVSQLEYLDFPEIDVFIHENTDSNIIDLLEAYTLKYKFKIREIPWNSKVLCDKFIDVDPCAIVTDGANYTSVTDKLFYAGLKEFYKEYNSTSIRGMGTKLFLARRGRRTLSNIIEIERYFQSQGYEIVDNCHELTIGQKKELFGNASYIVGPGGSAFFNCIWCPRDVKILTFINYEIAYDNCLQNMLSEESEIYHIAGKEINYKFYNSDYYIELDEIIHYAKELGFTS